MSDERKAGCPIRQEGEGRTHVFVLGSDRCECGAVRLLPGGIALGPSDGGIDYAPPAFRYEK